MRILFSDKESCAKFFEEAKESFGLRSWRELGKFVGTSRSMIDKYRERKLCLPEERFNILLSNLSNERKEYFLRSVKKKEDNWGQIEGGKKAYLINKKYFDDGRKIAAKNKEEKYKFDINMPLSKELCEFIGAFIGDGFTNKYGYLCHTEITGDRKLDRDYYYNRLKPICQKLFNITPHIYERRGYIRLILYSKNLFEMLTKRFGVPAGVKSYSIKIPEEIYDYDGELLNYILRGMFDTDGGIGIDKRTSYKKPYIRINYTSVSKELINQVSTLLFGCDIKHSVHIKGNSFMIQINGTDNVKKFISKIGFSNKRHLDKINKFL